jgi:hypothetical protein
LRIGFRRETSLCIRGHATPEGETVGAGYMKITNNGKEADRLTGGTFESADKVEVHEMKMEGDKMTMRQLADGLEIKPGETVELNPGSGVVTLISFTAETQLLAYVRHSYFQCLSHSDEHQNRPNFV